MIVKKNNCIKPPQFKFHKSTFTNQAREKEILAILKQYSDEWFTNKEKIIKSISDIQKSINSMIGNQLINLKQSLKKIHTHGTIKS